MKPRALNLMLGLCLCACSSLPDNRVRTLGQSTELKTPSRGNWFLAARPSLVRMESSAHLPPDIDVAIRNYDALADSASDPATRTESARRAAYLRIRRAEVDGDAHAELALAIRSLEDLLKQHPEDSNRDLSRYQLARAYQAAGQPQRASAQLRDLLEQSDSQLAQDVAFRLAELEFMQHNYAAASPLYRRVLSANPQAALARMARYKLGWSAYRLGQFALAIDTFGSMLENNLPPPSQLVTAQDLDALLAADDPWIGDALRVTSLSLIELGGPDALARHYGTAANEPDYYPLVYASLGALYLEKHMLNSAADTFERFSSRHPQHALAPHFDQRQIGIFRDAGYTAEALRSMSEYAIRYAPDAAYWSAQASDPAVLARVHSYARLVAEHHHALAQAAGAEGHAHYRDAADWYLRLLKMFPDAADAADIELLVAETFQAIDQPQPAAEHFLRAAYAYPGFERAADAAYAAVLILQHQADNAAQAQRKAALTRVIESGLKLAEHFTEHPHWAAVVIKTAENLAAQERWSDAANQAARALASTDLSQDLRIAAASVQADAHFALADYAAAESAYGQLLALLPAEDGNSIADQLAVAIYRQGEQAREQGQAAQAAAHFLRVGQRVPQASIRIESDFDAAAMLLSINDLAAAEPVLEQILWRKPDHKLASETRRKLAAVYQQRGKHEAAASIYAAMSNDSTLPLQTRRQAAWQSAELYERGGETRQAVSAYADYARRYAEPLSQALRARQRLAELSRDQIGDLKQYTHWLEALIQTEHAAGAARDEQSRLRAAQAALELGRLEAARASGVRIQAPLEQSLSRRKAQMERAIGWLRQAADAGFTQTTPAAIFAMGVSYGEFAHALLHAPAPAGLSPLEAEEFAFLLEEQAFPFEELAIELHEQNLLQLGHGLWNVWIDRSTQALAELVPAKYAKSELLAQRYVPLH